MDRHVAAKWWVGLVKACAVSLAGLAGNSYMYLKMSLLDIGPIIFGSTEGLIDYLRRHHLQLCGSCNWNTYTTHPPYVVLSWSYIFSSSKFVTHTEINRIIVTICIVDYQKFTIY